MTLSTSVVDDIQPEQEQDNNQQQQQQPQYAAAAANDSDSESDEDEEQERTESFLAVLGNWPSYIRNISLCCCLCTFVVYLRLFIIITVLGMFSFLFVS